MYSIWASFLFAAVVFRGVDCFLLNSDDVLWTSTYTLKNQSTIPACVGEDLSLPWTYTLVSGHLVDVQWHFTPAGHTTTTAIASLVNGQFLINIGAVQHMQYIPNAGIRLLNVQTSYSGTYYVRINVLGATHDYPQAVTVLVTSSSITTSGSLSAYLQSTPVYSSGQDHLVLVCGTFSSLWDSRVDVTWQTPSHHTLSSTSHSGGRFYLNVPNPIEQGSYTCQISTSSAIRHCIPSNSSLLQSASVSIDTTAGTLTLMNAHMQRLETQNSQLQQQLNTLNSLYSSSHSNSEITNLKNQIAHLEKNIIETRLVNGFNSGEGRVEVRLFRGMIGGSWGSVCDDAFGLPEAQVICRNLGFPATYPKAWGSAKFGTDSGTILMDDLSCDGTEASLVGCTFGGFGQHNCGHSEDAGVTCFDMRLVGGSNSHSGRIEIQIGSGSWGTVCDDSWSTGAARVVCKMMGYPYSNAVAWSGAHFGAGTLPILLDDVTCTGSEDHLLTCGHSPYGHHNCGHSEDAGVTCA